jgi:hypothetical protein
MLIGALMRATGWAMRRRRNLTWLKLLIGVLVVVYAYQKLSLPSSIPSIPLITDSYNDISPSVAQGVVFIPSASGGPGVERAPFISSVRVCKDYGTILSECDTSEFHDNDDIYIYWEVLGGVGCCATFNCDYDAFFSACLDGGQRLYEIYLDGRMIENDGVYEYECEHRTPWNAASIINVPVGSHDVRILSKDCSRIIDDFSFSFDLAVNPEGGYVVTQQV